MYWIKMLLFVFILINIKINDQGHCSSVTTALVEYDDVSDGNLDLPVTKHEVTDERVDRSDEKTNTPVQKHGLIDGKVDRFDKKFKVADGSVAGSNYNTSNVTIVADINAIGSVNNVIELRNNVSNVEAYGIFENDTITFTFNVTDYTECSGDAPCNFKVDFGKDVVKFKMIKFTRIIQIGITINNTEAEAFKIGFTDSVTAKIKKDGKILIENDQKISIPSLKELETIPTKDSQQAVLIKFDGSELRNASVKLYFKTKVGKIFEEKPETVFQILVSHAGDKRPVDICIIGGGAIVFIAGVIIIIGSLITESPIQKLFGKLGNKVENCMKKKSKKSKKSRKRKTQ